jgi:uncharacterized Zn finger protein
MNSVNIPLAAFKVTPQVWGVTTGPVVSYVNLANGRCTCPAPGPALCVHFDAVAQTVRDEARAVTDRIRLLCTADRPVASNA